MVKHVIRQGENYEYNLIVRHYVLHMVYVDGYDYYSLSTESKSIFEVKGNTVTCSSSFKEDFNNRNMDLKDTFFDYIFK